MDNFRFIHQEGKLLVEVVIGENTYTKDITSIFEKHNAIDEFLDYHIGLNK